MAPSPNLTFPRFIIATKKPHSRRWKYHCRSCCFTLAWNQSVLSPSFTSLGLIIITFTPHSSSPWLVYQHLHWYLHLLEWGLVKYLDNFHKCIWRAPYIYICECLSYKRIGVSHLLLISEKDLTPIYSCKILSILNDSI
jgi:hypothetical protein